MGCTQSLPGNLFQAPEGFTKPPPVLETPQASSNIKYEQARYEKEFIATLLTANVGGKTLCIDTKARKLVLQSSNDGVVLGMAKRCGSLYRIFRAQPNYAGQSVSETLPTTSLYFHSQVERQGRDGLVFQVGQKEKPALLIRSGPGKFEKTVTDPKTNEDLASWEYYGLKNHVEIFQTNGRSCISDAGLLMFLVIIADFFDNEAERIGDAKAGVLFGYQGGATLY